MLRWRSARWALGGSVAAGLLALLVWAMKAPSSGVVMGAAASAPDHPQAWEPALTTARLQRSVPAPVDRASGPPLLANCGLGELRSVGHGQVPDEAALGRAIQQQGHQLQLQVLQQLLAGPDLEERATGWLLSLTPWVDKAIIVDCDGENCLQAKVDKQVARGNARQESSSPTVVDLVLAAQANASPYLYALADQACLSAPAAAQAACQGLSRQRWTALDPQDSLAWLALARTADARGDGAALNSALHGVSRASVSRELGPLVLARVMNHVPDAVQGWPLLSLTLAARSQASAWGRHSVQTLFKLCSEAARQDANRAQQCTALASSQMQQASDLSSLLVAVSLARRTGVSDAALAAAQQDLWWAQGASTELTRQFGSALDGTPAACQKLLALNAIDRAQAHRSERAVLVDRGRQAQQRSGLTPQAWAAEVAAQFRGSASDAESAPQ